MSLVSVKKIASRLLKAGESRIRIRDAAAAEKALTADDVRGLIKEGAVVKIAEQGTGRGKARKADARKRKGRGRGPGTVRGASSSAGKKRRMRKVRALRKLLRKLRPSLAKGAYKRIYRMVKGGSLRDKQQLREYATKTRNAND